MSSFIVRQKGMNNIINGLFYDGDDNGIKRILSEKGYSNSKGFQKLGDDLYALNLLAVNSRYSEKGEKVKFVWASGTPSKIQVLKSLHCLRYQCSEDKADNTMLFKLLEKVISLLENEIINKLPEYDKAEWD